LSASGRERIIVRIPLAVSVLMCFMMPVKLTIQSKIPVPNWVKISVFVSKSDLVSVGTVRINWFLIVVLFLSLPSMAVYFNGLFYI
jgi:hypothetical protein